MKGSGYILFLVFAFLLAKTHAQEVTGSLIFSQETVTLGEIIPEITHPEEVVLIFPDSTYDLSPFEWVRAVPERTITDNGVSTDAITYFIRTMGLQEKLVLTLPYYHIVGGDTVETFEESNTVTLQKQVLTLSPTPPFRVDDSLIRVADPLNYLLLTGIGIALVAMLVLLGFALRKPLRRYWARRRLQREWAAIQRRLRTLTKKPPAAPVYLEQLNQIWKDYLDPKGVFALRSLTTTELGPVLTKIPEAASSKDLLLRTAKAGDQVIYAGMEMEMGKIASLKSEVTGVLKGVYGGRLKEVKRRS